MKRATQLATLLLFAAAIVPVHAQEPVPVLIDQTGVNNTSATVPDDSELPLRQRALFDRGAEKPSNFTLSGEVLGMYDDDITGAAGSAGGEMTQMSLFATFDKRWGNNAFRADYTPTFNDYAQYSNLNFMAQAYDQEFEHRISPRTQIDWTARVSHYSSRYLNPSDPTRFGDLTFVVPDLESLSGVNQMIVTSAYSQLAFLHQTSAKDTWNFAVLGGTSRFTPDGSFAGFNPLAESFVTGGTNIGWTHKNSERTSFGVSVTGGYTAENDPTTHELDETIQATYSQMIGHWRLDLSGGPLIRQVPANTAFEKGNSYVVNAGGTRKIGRSTVNVFYARSLQMGFVDGSVLGDVISGTIRHSLSARLFVGAGGSYQHSDYPGASLNGFIATGQLGYHVSRNLIFLTNYIHGQQDAAGELQALGYHRNQYSAGLSYDFTHMLPRPY